MASERDSTMSVAALVLRGQVVEGGREQARRHRQGRPRPQAAARHGVPEWRGSGGLPAVHPALWHPKHCRSLVARGAAHVSAWPNQRVMGSECGWACGRARGARRHTRSRRRAATLPAGGPAAACSRPPRPSAACPAASEAGAGCRRAAAPPRPSGPTASRKVSAYCLGACGTGGQCSAAAPSRPRSWRQGVAPRQSTAQPPSRAGSMPAACAGQLARIHTHHHRKRAEGGAAQAADQQRLRRCGGADDSTEASARWRPAADWQRRRRQRRRSARRRAGCVAAAAKLLPSLPTCSSVISNFILLQGREEGKEGAVLHAACVAGLVRRRRRPCTPQAPQAASRTPLTDRRHELR